MINRLNTEKTAITLQRLMGDKLSKGQLGFIDRLDALSQHNVSQDDAE